MCWLPAASGHKTGLSLPKTSAQANSWKTRAAATSLVGTTSLGGATNVASTAGGASAGGVATGGTKTPTTKPRSTSRYLQPRERYPMAP